MRQSATAQQAHHVLEVCLPLDRDARSEPVPCPICGDPLRWTAAPRLDAFECDRCGHFSDFGGVSPSPPSDRPPGPSGAKR